MAYRSLPGSQQNRLRKQSRRSHSRKKPCARFHRRGRRRESGRPLRPQRRRFPPRPRQGRSPSSAVRNLSSNRPSGRSPYHRQGQQPQGRHHHGPPRAQAGRVRAVRHRRVAADFRRALRGRKATGPPPVAHAGPPGKGNRAAPLPVHVLLSGQNVPGPRLAARAGRTPAGRRGLGVLREADRDPTRGPAKPDRMHGVQQDRAEPGPMRDPQERDPDSDPERSLMRNGAPGPELASLRHRNPGLSREENLTPLPVRPAPAGEGTPRSARRQDASSAPRATQVQAPAGQEQKRFVPAHHAATAGREIRAARGGLIAMRDGHQDALLHALRGRLPRVAPRVPLLRLDGHPVRGDRLIGPVRRVRRARVQYAAGYAVGRPVVAAPAVRDLLVLTLAAAPRLARAQHPVQERVGAGQGQDQRQDQGQDHPRGERPAGVRPARFGDRGPAGTSSRPPRTGDRPNFDRPRPGGFGKSKPGSGGRDPKGRPPFKPGSRPAKPFSGKPGSARPGSAKPWSRPGGSSGKPGKPSSNFRGPRPDRKNPGE